MTPRNDPKGIAARDRCPLHLIPAGAMEATAWVHLLGADKYEPYNWRVNNVSANTYIGAIFRHLNKWRDGEDIDAESGQPHLAHIAANCNILMDAQTSGTLDDDRYKKP